MSDRSTSAYDDAVPSEAEPAAAPTALYGSSPRLLCFCEQEPSWMALTLGLSQAGLGPPRLLWVSTSRDAISRQRDEPFDCVLIDVPPRGASIHDDRGPFGLLRALRTAGCTEPAVLVGRLFTDAEWAEACALNADVFVSPRAWNSPALGGMVKRAVARGELARENQRLTAAQERRLLRERDESEQLLAQQRQIIADLESLPDPLQDAPCAPRTAEPGTAWSRPPSGGSGRSPVEFADRYAALLRSYVLMGSGSLSSEIAEIVEGFVAARIAPPDALQLHLECVEKLVKGLGNRSARHVVARGDLLAVEMMTRLAHRNQHASAGGTPAWADSALPVRNVSGAAGIDLTRADDPA